MIVLTVVLFWLLTDDSFRVTEADVRFEGLGHADEAAVREHLVGLDRSPNVFRVRSSEIVADLQALPEVVAAVATVTLPSSVSVYVDEREPIFAWSDGETSWLVDRDGMLFAPGPSPAAAAAPEPSGSAEPIDQAVLDLPVVEDERLVAEPPTIGSLLPAIDVRVMRQLLALTPELLGSRAETLQLRVDQRDGYVLHSDRGWQAVFGHYTPTLQPPEVVPRQVQCLRWLLASQERQLERVRLAVSDEACGTFTEFGRQG
jgi:hypothetical protein